MNARKFDRRTVERYISRGFGLQDFIEKYDFADEDDFRSQLAKIFSDEDKANRMIKDLKKKDKKKNETPKKAATVSAEGKRLGKIATELLQSVNDSNTSPSVVKNIETSIKADALSYMPMKKGVPYATESESLGSLTKAIKNVTVDILETVNVKGVDTATEDMTAVISNDDSNELEKLKLKLAEYKNTILELDNTISENIVSAESKVNSLKDAMESVKKLKQQIEAEKARVQTIIEETFSLEKSIREQKEHKKLLNEQIKSIEQQIKNLEIKTIYFGSDNEAEYDVFAEKVELESAAFAEKLNNLLSSSKFEDLSVKNLKMLARVLCIIEKVSKEFDEKIEIYFDSEEYEAIFNDVKLMFPNFKMEIK